MKHQMGGESQAQYGMALKKTLLIRNFLETFDPYLFMRNCFSKMICWHQKVQLKISTIIEFDNLIIKITMFMS
jgi:hypothetical protein